MFFPVLKKKPFFVTVLEDGGYTVIFSKGNLFLRHITTGQMKYIDVKVKNLYVFEV